MCGRREHWRKNVFLAAVVTVVAIAHFNVMSRCHDFGGIAENMQTGLKEAIELLVNFGDTTPFYIPGSLQDLWDSLLAGISCPLTPQFHHKRLVFFFVLFLFIGML